MGVPSTLPVMRDMDACAYYKEDAGKLLIGAFEPKAKPWGMNGIPRGFLLRPSCPRISTISSRSCEGAIHRVPRLAETGIRKFFNGPESFTPDQRYLLGEAPELKNFYVAAGFNSIGIQSAGGVGMALAALDRRGPSALRPLGRRYPPLDAAPEQQDLPHRPRLRGARPALRHALALPPVRDRPRRPPHAALRAPEGSTAPASAKWPAGSVPTGSRPRASSPKYQYSFKRQNWFDYCGGGVTGHARQPSACSTSRPSPSSWCAGPTRRARCSASAPTMSAVAPGRAVYTQWLNERGGIEADLTVTRLAEDAYMVVTAAATAVRDLPWLKRHIAADARVTVDDITNRPMPCSASWARTAARCCRRSPTADLSNAAFPFGTVAEIEIGYARLRAHPHQLHGRARLGALRAGGVRASASSTASWRTGRRTVSSSAACTPWTACASRRPIATGATTSATRTRRSKPGSASPSPRTRTSLHRPRGAA